MGATKKMLKDRNVPLELSVLLKITYSRSARASTHLPRPPRAPWVITPWGPWDTPWGLMGYHMGPHGVTHGAPWGNPWGPMGTPWGPMGTPWGSMEYPMKPHGYPMGYPTEVESEDTPGTLIKLANQTLTAAGFQSNVNQNLTDFCRNHTTCRPEYSGS